MVNPSSHSTTTTITSPVAFVRRGRVPLIVQFTFFVILIISGMMFLTTMLTYLQQQKSLRDEVVKRGVTITRNLANSASEGLMNELTCATLIHQAMPESETEFPEITIQSLVDSLWQDIFHWEQDSYDRIINNAGVTEILMVDTNGIIRAHNDMQRVEKPYQLPEGLKPYNGEAILVQPYKAANGEKRFDFAAPIFVTKEGGKRLGVVHLAMSQTLVEFTVKYAAMKLLFMTGIMVLLGMIAAFIMAQYLTQPIKTLVQGVLAIAAGDLNQEFKVTRKDELGELTQAFNQMAASLREKELIKGAFSTYVSSQVMEEVLKDPTKLALGGARKKATIFFSDIRGFTSMSETMQPEEVVSIINAYLSAQTEIIIRNGGMLDKFVGDCAMAVYGIPLAKPDDPLRAVRSALEIQKAVQQLNVARKAAGEKTVMVGIGINTGEVVSGNMGSAQKMDYTVIGDAVNLAARLESVAEGGSILISEDTYELVKEHIEAEKLSPLAIKGKKDKVLVYCVKSLKV